MASHIDVISHTDDGPGGIWVGENDDRDESFKGLNASPLGFWTTPTSSIRRTRHDVLVDVPHMSCRLNPPLFP